MGDWISFRLFATRNVVCKVGKGRLTGRDTLDTATTSETTDGGLGDALNVVTENLSVTLGSTFAETLATFSACCGRVSMLMLG